MPHTSSRKAQGGLMTIAFAAPQYFKNALHPQEEKETLWFLFSGDQLLVSFDKKTIPTTHTLPLLRSVYMGTLEDKHLFAAETEQQIAQSGWLWVPLRFLHGCLPEEYYALAGRAASLLNWDRTHAYCGRCGSPTFSRKQERCKECSACGHLAYPKMAPAIMALVKKGNKILLARSPHFPEKLYSVLAGFVDPGETLEQCVIREVQEEVGLQVKNLQYFGSQPWPLSHSLMIGFTCEWASGEIQTDPLEIEDARWFEHTNLPQIPTNISLARPLIDSAFLNS